jgi:predicted dehydrogenase
VIKVGIVGCGRILPAHLHAFKTLIEKNVDVRITALCDVNLENAKRYWKRDLGIPPFYTGGPPGDPLAAPPIYLDEFQKDTEVKIYDNYKNMLEDADIDAVNIYTSVDSHHTIAIDSLEAGKHVLVEKPFAISVRAAQKMVGAAEKFGKILGVAESLRYYPHIRMAKWAIEQGYIGELKMSISGQVGGYWSPDKIVAKTPWRHKKILGGGGATVDVGVHLLDILRYFCGEIDEMYSVVSTITKIRTIEDEKGNTLKVECDADDTFISTFTFERGVIGHLHWSWFGPVEPIGIPFFTLYGTKGCISGNMIIMNDGTKIVLQKLFEEEASKDVKEKYFPYGIKDPMALETLDFIKAVEEGKDMETSGKEGLKDLAAAFAMLESSLLKRPVKVKEVEEGKLSNYEKEINEYYKI